MATRKKNTIDHRDKKSQGAQEFFDKQRAARNAARPKQFWTGGESVKEGGHWERAAATEASITN